MMYDVSDISSEDEEFIASERPEKRRRLNEVESSWQSGRDGSEADEYDLPSNDGPRSGNGCDDTESPRAAGAKSRHLMHVPQFDESQEQIFVTQLTQPHSSPERIRGPRWKKKPPSPPVAGPSFKAPVEAPSRLPVDEPPRPEATTTSFDEDDEFDEDDTAFLEAILSSPGLRGSHNDEVLVISSQNELPASTFARKQPTSFRQTTLFGNSTTAKTTSASQSKVHNWPLSNKVEPPTHHKLNTEAMKTWVYPTNLGKTRDYQFNIAQRGLFHNLLVALPTGLGKTFIAATIMLNWFRWTVDSQIVFVAPTKPLVSQQIDACFNIAGIPKSQTSMLTGGVQAVIRGEEWQDKRVFFLTPQTLINDLKRGICDPKKIVLLVVDEAHRATGNYAYVEIVRFLRRFNTSFRILALTATPGSSVETVQNVIDGLDIARTEIRTEDSLDIREFVHRRNIEIEIFQNSDEMTTSMELFGNAIRPVMAKLSSQNAYWSKDPLSITPFGLSEARRKWMGSDAGRKADFGLKGMVNSIFTVLASLAHALELVKYHGIGPFFGKLRSFEDEVLDGSTKGKYAKQIATDEHFQKLMNRLRGWINNPDFVGHPKLSYLKEVALNHFMDAGEGRGAAGGRPPSDTRIMIFVHFRDSAEEVTRVLKRHEPMIRPHVFVGQSSAKGSEGMDQKTQLSIIEKFKKGTYNTLVATSIGEEGLDIGEVDLIVCYDSSSSPIRMLQRMGRTGRKRAGNIVLLLMDGKEHESYVKAKDNYEKMQEKIANGSEFNYHYDRSVRIVPKDINPVVDKREVEIPLENSQAGMPEPKKRARKNAKLPPKRFNMPDGVETGFTFLGGEKKASKDATTARKHVSVEPSIDENVAVLPSLESVLLSREDEERLDQSYCTISGDTPQDVQIPRFDTFPSYQRGQRRISKVTHSTATRRVVGAYGRMQDRNLYSTVPRQSQADILDEDPVEKGLDHSEDEENPLDEDSTLPSSGSVAVLEETEMRQRHVRDDGAAVRVLGDSDSDIEEIVPLKIPPRAKETQDVPFYVSQQSAADEDHLEDDLPDFEKMVSSKKGSQSNLSNCQTTRRTVRGRRLVLDDDDSD
jgi:ATP-dependent DNA helicase MPH1